ncbi:MAG: tryptophan--tRNA ligase [Gemmataceae bacterium]|nr:tryptophan--tRNA ligase [Gemmataceae bacterium]
MSYSKWKSLKLPPDRRRVLSGVQPSGKLHLGNYFGAIRQHIASQDEDAERFIFIADYHSMTTVTDGAQRRALTLDVALDYLALGLDPAKTTFFRQSDVPEVHELAWMLACVTNTGLIEKAHSFKDKIAKGIEPSVGLFTYPILMASDILIYRSNWVPVGDDQVQHLELTRDMAGKFNRAYGEVFPLPQALLVEAGAKVPGTDGQKMSKSYGNTIDIFAEGKALKKSVMGIVTDSTPLEGAKDPTTCTIFALYQLFATQDETDALAAMYRAGGMGYGTAKSMLLEKIDERFGPARERRRELAGNLDYVEGVLRAGAARARAEAEITMGLARKAAGL